MADPALSLPRSWMPDSAVDACTICNAAFSVTFRRHHCRVCGTVVCGNCSKARLGASDVSLTQHPDPRRGRRPAALYSHTPISKALAAATRAGNATATAPAAPRESEKSVREEVRRRMAAVVANDDSRNGREEPNAAGKNGHTGVFGGCSPDGRAAVPRATRSGSGIGSAFRFSLSRKSVSTRGIVRICDRCRSLSADNARLATRRIDRTVGAAGVSRSLTLSERLARDQARLRVAAATSFKARDTVVEPTPMPMRSPWLVVRAKRKKLTFLNQRRCWKRFARGPAPRVCVGRERRWDLCCPPACTVFTFLTEST